MTGFELRISGFGSDCSTNWATTTCHFFNWQVQIWEGDKISHVSNLDGIFLEIPEFICPRNK